MKVALVAVQPGFRWGALFSVVTLILAIMFVWQLPPEVPIFFSLPQGKEQLGAGWWLSLLPLLSGGGLVLNYFLTRVIPSIPEVMVSLLSWMTALNGLIFLIAMVHILLLVY